LAFIGGGGLARDVITNCIINLPCNFLFLTYQNGILHPLTELRVSSTGCIDCRDSPDIDWKAQPVLLGDSIYTRGTLAGDRNQTIWKYSIPMNSWSPMPSPSGVDANDYVLASYRSQLVWIGGRVHTGKQEEANTKVFVYEQDKGWKKDTSIPPLPDCLLRFLNVFASGDDNYLVVADRSKLLVFDGRQWQRKYCPGRNMRVAVLIHCGTLYLIIQKDGEGSFCKVSVQSLLAENDHDWEKIKFPYASDTMYSLTVVNDHVTMAASIGSGLDLRRTLYVLSLSSTSNSWIGLIQLSLDHCGVRPNIVGFPNGKLLLMGYMKTKDPRSQNLSPAAAPRQLPNPQFKVIEMTPNGMLCMINPRRMRERGLR
jgi:hypothetical protein